MLINLFLFLFLLKKIVFILHHAISFSAYIFLLFSSMILFYFITFELSCLFYLSFYFILLVK